MSSGIRRKMLNPELLLLATCVTLSTAIRVDFGTKSGPIVPAIPTTTVRPKPPFRNSAPVWEDQSNDIPNPNPYQYILPPPSRPKPLTNDFNQPSHLVLNQQKPREFDFGKIISPNDVNSWLTPTVSGLSPQFIPNYGFKYNGIVPSSPKKYYTKNTDFYYNEKFNKFNGKYNIKTKKYKAYEKVKYAPQVYYSIELPALSFEQELPLPQAPQPFRMPEATHTTTQPTTFRVSTPKLAYTKDDLNGISANYKTPQTNEQNSLSYDSQTTRR